jgi:sodium transport system permease protein
MLGLSSWAVAYEIFALQSYFFPSSPETLEAFRSVQAQLEAAPLWLLVLLAAIIPAVSEEFLFRGFVLSGLGGNRYKWTAIVGTAVVFAVYHFYAEKVLITAMLGVVLAYVCWQSRSIWPAILFHALHNGLLMSVVSEATAVAEWLGIAEETQASHLPVYVLTPAALLFLGGLAILARTPHSRTTPSVPPSES